ncbi:MAG: hypothetical protein LCH76_00500 [Actinobacteria bacterium]|jgi:hypothetical protein|nr:hypothetical protein [Actinomycetota bacterium]
MALDDLRVSRLAFAGVSALTVLTWHALPDVVRSRRARVVVKSGLLGVTAAGAAMIPQVFPALERPVPESRSELSGPTIAVLVLGGLVAGVAGAVWFEKAVYAHGERRRADGVRCPHTRAAVVMALATGAAALADWNWTRLVRKVSAN